MSATQAAWNRQSSPVDIEKGWEYLGPDGTMYGPFTLQYLQKLLQQSFLNPDQQVRPVGSTAWIELWAAEQPSRYIDSAFPALGGSSVATQRTKPVAVPQPGGWAAVAGASGTGPVLSPQQNRSSSSGGQTAGYKPTWGSQSPSSTAAPAQRNVPAKPSVQQRQQSASSAPGNMQSRGGGQGRSAPARNGRKQKSVGYVDEREWLLKRRGEAQGPFTGSQMRAFLEDESFLDSEVLVKKSDWKQYKPLEEVFDLIVQMYSLPESHHPPEPPRPRQPQQPPRQQQQSGRSSSDAESNQSNRWSHGGVEIAGEPQSRPYAAELGPRAAEYGIGAGAGDGTSATAGEPYGSQPPLAPAWTPSAATPTQAPPLLPPPPMRRPGSAQQQHHLPPHQPAVPAMAMPPGLPSQYSGLAYSVAPPPHSPVSQVDTSATSMPAAPGRQAQLLGLTLGPSPEGGPSQAPSPARPASPAVLPSGPVVLTMRAGRSYRPPLYNTQPPSQAPAPGIDGPGAAAQPAAPPAPSPQPPAAAKKPPPGFGGLPAAAAAPAPVHAQTPQPVTAASAAAGGPTAAAADQPKPALVSWSAMNAAKKAAGSQAGALQQAPPAESSQAPGAGQPAGVGQQTPAGAAPSAPLAALHAMLFPAERPAEQKGPPGGQAAAGAPLQPAAAGGGQLGAAAGGPWGAKAPAPAPAAAWGMVAELAAPAPGQRAAGSKKACAGCGMYTAVNMFLPCGHFGHCSACLPDSMSNDDKLARAPSCLACGRAASRYMRIYR